MLFFLVVTALTIAALLFVQRSVGRAARFSDISAQLLAAAESAAFGALANWDGSARERQVIGSTARFASEQAHATVDLYLTRLTLRVFSIVASARAPSGISRRVELVVRVPALTQIDGALVSAVNVTIGSEVRFVSDTGVCGAGAAAIALAPEAAMALDPALPDSARPTVRIDSAAADSATSLRVGGDWWGALTGAADVTLPRDAHVSPAPVVSGDVCMPSAGNWGDPTHASKACGSRAPLIYAAGDLTIDGGVGQGVLLVDGRLTIAGPFVFSGQIVARHGIETRADNITISGVVYAWRASADTTASHAPTNEIMLTHRTTMRRSVCDARHGVASSLQPRRVRDRAFAELF